MRDFVTEDTLNMIYYSFVYKGIQYRFTTWGTAAQKQLHVIEVRLNIIQAIKLNKRFSRSTIPYKNLKCLKLNDVCELELAKFIIQLHH